MPCCRGFKKQDVEGLRTHTEGLDKTRSLHLADKSACRPQKEIKVQIQAIPFLNSNVLTLPSVESLQASILGL